MQLWQYCLLITARLLYMFRTLSASIIRGTKNCSSSHLCMSWVGVMYIHSMLYKESTRCNFGSIVYQSLQDHSTCFGRFLRPSSGVQKLQQQPLVHIMGRGDISSKGVRGRLLTALCHSLWAMTQCSRQPTLDVLTGYISSRPMTQLLLQFLVLLMMDAKTVRNMQSDLAVTNKQYCQSCILLILYITQNGYTSPRPMTCTSGCYCSFCTPDDGRRKRPKHVE